MVEEISACNAQLKGTVKGKEQTLTPMGACSINRGINVQGIKYKGIGSSVRNKQDSTQRYRNFYFASATFIIAMFSHENLHAKMY